MYILSVCLLLLSNVVSADNSRLSVTHYSVADGLPQNTVMSIIEDSEGFLWVGTWDGLARFDGYTFRTYKPVDAALLPGSNRVDWLHEDSEGFIWLQTNDGSFYRLDKHTDAIISLGVRDVRFGSGATSEHLWIEQESGIVWVAGDNRLLRVEQKANDKMPKITSYNLHGVASVIGCTGGTVWVGTNSGLECYEGGNVRFLRPDKNISGNNFTSIYATAGRLWLGTSAGVLWRYSLSTARFERVSLPVSSAINCIVSPSTDTLLISTEGDGLVLLDCRSLQPSFFSSRTVASIRSNSFGNMYVDRNGNTWVTNNESGVWCYMRGKHNLKRYVAEPDERYKNLLRGNFFAVEDAAGRLWLNPQGGGFSYYSAEKDGLVSLQSVTNMIHSACVDSHGSMWLGTYDLGLDRIDATQKRFKLVDMRRSANHQGEVRAIAKSKNGGVILAVKDLTVKTYSDDFVPQYNLVSDELVYSIYDDFKGNVYLGTRGDGLIVQSDNKTARFRHSEGNKESLSNDNIYDMLLTSDSTLFVATYGGGINVLRDGVFVNSDNFWTDYPEFFGSKVRELCLIDDTTLWAATTAGLLVVNTKDLSTRTFPYSDIRCFNKTDDGHVWVGTFGGGLLDISNPYYTDLFASENCKVYNRTNGLLSDIVLAMAQDEHGNLWFTYEDGISFYDRHADIILHFDVFDAPSAHFGEAKSCVTDDGAILFGYNHGVCVLQPEQVYVSDDAPRLYLTGLNVAGENITPQTSNLLKHDILYTDEVRLNNHQRVFSIEYAAVDPASAGKIRYAYRLDNADTDWHYVGHERRAIYTNLSPGHYVFRVRSTNGDGIWTNNERCLNVVISPSFWATPAAMVIYIVIFLLFVWLVYRSLKANSKLKEEIEVEQKVTDIKLRFFTNISHELRTPLTLISGPVDNILQNEHISDSVRQQLEIVGSNAARMLKLINEILDFRKIQNNKMRLSVRETNLTEFAKNIYSNFTKEATDKHITFTFVDEHPNTIVWVDRDKLDTIVYNLLSNAFKFTPSAGTVTLLLSQKNNYALIRVSDTGIGIPKEQRSVLFERFSSNNEINNSADKAGTGIGLNLVRELVNLHHGYIEVESEPGKGSTFTVMLQFGKEHYGREADIILSAPESDVVTGDLTVAETEDYPFEPQKKTILLVDDNADMRAYLRSIIASEYNTYIAADGKEALEIAMHHNIELVITDLMMPQMDGLELTNILKTHTSTSHIPIILLTAKSAIESRLEALRYGADDYLTKPFSPAYLTARVDNLLRQRDRLQETYRTMLMQAGDANALGNKVNLSPDELFLQKLQQYMLDNIDNNAITVDDLVKEMALGRTVFFNKLKGLTGLSPVEYIRNIRLRHAAELLLDEKNNVTDVTYMIGMNDSRYFSKCFKAVYGVTPTEYRKSKLQKKS